MTIYDTIQELRAEWRACCDRAERKQIEAELAAAIAEQAKLDVAFDAELARMFPPPS